MEDGRLNLSDTTAIAIELFGHQLHMAQNPNSKHLGTTVWDASMVFAKFLEKNCRKGRFCSSKLRGKRAIELGAGCGLAGIGMALLGCDVISTDQTEVLPLLMRNIERNTSRIMQAYPESAIGTIEVAELDWGNEEHIKAVGPPFDFIIGTDVVYAERLLEPLLQTILALSGPRTTIMLGYEIRSTVVHDQMLSLWKSNFEMKSIPRSKMDGKYQHPSIQIFVMELKHTNRTEESVKVTKSFIGQSEENFRETSKFRDSQNGSDQGFDSCKTKDWEDDTDSDGVSGETGSQITQTKVQRLDDWEARRYGAMAARLLRDVNIT